MVLLTFTDDFERADATDLGADWVDQFQMQIVMGRARSLQGGGFARHLLGIGSKQTAKIIMREETQANGVSLQIVDCGTNTFSVISGGVEHFPFDYQDGATDRYLAASTAKTSVMQAMIDYFFANAPIGSTIAITCLQGPDGNTFGWVGVTSASDVKDTYANRGTSGINIVGNANSPKLGLAVFGTPLVAALMTSGWGAAGDTADVSDLVAAYEDFYPSGHTHDASGAGGRDGDAGGYDLQPTLDAAAAKQLDLDDIYCIAWPDLVNVEAASGTPGVPDHPFYNDYHPIGSDGHDIISTSSYTFEITANNLKYSKSDLTIDYYVWGYYGLGQGTPSITQTVGILHNIVSAIATDGDHLFEEPSDLTAMVDRLIEKAADVPASLVGLGVIIRQDEDQNQQIEVRVQDENTLFWRHFNIDDYEQDTIALGSPLVDNDSLEVQADGDEVTILVNDVIVHTFTTFVLSTDAPYVGLEANSGSIELFEATVLTAGGAARRIPTVFTNWFQ